MNDAWTRLAEVSNRIDLLEIALASGALDPEAETRLRNQLEQERQLLRELERQVGLRPDDASG